MEKARYSLGIQSPRAQDNGCHTVGYFSGVFPYVMDNTSLKPGEFDSMPGLMLSKMANSLKDNNSFSLTQYLTTLYPNYFLSLTPQMSLGA